MNKIAKDKIEEYSNQALDIGGTNRKRFVRLDSSLLKNYLREAIKSNCSYVTYIDDFIKENCTKDNKNIPLKYVSVLMKKQRVDYINDTSIKEAIGSQVANLIGVPTVYNERVVFEDSYFTMSIDFVKEGNEIDHLIEYKDSPDDCSNYWEWENDIERQFNQIIPDTNPNKQKNIEEIEHQFVQQYCLKNLILDDWDFKPRNLVYVKDLKNDTYSLGPVSDYEYILSYRKEDYFDKNCIDNVNYFLRHYKDEIDAFNKKINKAFYKNGCLQKDKLHKIFEKETIQDKDYMKLIDQLYVNIERFHNTYLELTNSKNLGKSDNLCR